MEQLSCLGWSSSCYLELLNKLQKWICKTVGPALAVSLELFTHCWNVASSSLFHSYYFGRSSSELAQLVPLPYSRGRSNSLHDFSVTIPRRYNDDYVNSFFPTIAWLWNSLPTESFPFTCDLKEVKCRKEGQEKLPCAYRASKVKSRRMK